MGPTERDHVATLVLRSQRVLSSPLRVGVVLRDAPASGTDRGLAHAPKGACWPREGLEPHWAPPLPAATTAEPPAEVTGPARTPSSPSLTHLHLLPCGGAGGWTLQKLEMTPRRSRTCEH